MTVAETTKQTLWEAEIHRTAGEIALMSPKLDAAKAEAHFGRAGAIARAQEAKSWELRAATSLARLWRDQGKRNEAHDASVFHGQRDGALAAPRHEIASKAEILVRTGLTTVGQAGGDVGLEEAARVSSFRR